MPLAGSPEPARRGTSTTAAASASPRAAQARVGDTTERCWRDDAVLFLTVGSMAYGFMLASCLLSGTLNWVAIVGYGLLILVPILVSVLLRLLPGWSLLLLAVAALSGFAYQAWRYDPRGPLPDGMLDVFSSGSAQVAVATLVTFMATGWEAMRREHVRRTNPCRDESQP